MTRRMIKAGAKKYRPAVSPGFSLNRRSARVRIAMPRASWWDRREAGADAKDWVKAGGLTFFHPFKPATWPIGKPKHTALLGFRPSLEPGIWEACPYTNDPGVNLAEDDDRVIGSFSSKETGGYADLGIYVRRNRVYYDLTTVLYDDARVVAAEDPFRHQPISFFATTWHGGNYPALRDHKVYSTIE